MKKQFLFGLSVALLGLSACGTNDTPTPDPVDNSGVVTLEGDLSSRTLTADKKYLLKGFVYVLDGQTLTIEPGTLIMGDKVTKGSLVVSKGGKVEAHGTASKPIIFTSALPPGSRRDGDWGGIIILGKAPINPTGGSAKIEGGLTPTNGGDEQKYIFYGGNNANDNSGTLEYVRIEFAGVAFSPDNEINGLTLGGVGAGTKISYVQVYRAGDDAIEWFGGTVNADHLVTTYTLDDDFDTDFGYAGNVQFGVAQRFKNIADVSGSNGFESDNDGNGSTNAPKTKAIFSNMTIVGPIATATSGTSGINGNFQNGAQIRRNSAESIMNSILIGFPVGLYIDDSKGSFTSDNIASGELKFRKNIIAGSSTPFKKSSTWVTGQDWFDAEVAAGNITVLDSAQKVMLQDPYKFSSELSAASGRPDYRLKAASIANTGANFNGMPGFFQNVPYIGAFDGTTDWTSGWATFSAETNVY